MDPGPKDVNYDPLALESVSEPRDFGGGELWKNFDDFDPSIDRKYPLDERHFFLFPKKIPGMSLKYKQWCESYLLSLSFLIGQKSYRR